MHLKRVARTLTSSHGHNRTLARLWRYLGIQLHGDIDMVHLFAGERAVRSNEGNDALEELGIQDLGSG